MSEDIIQLRSHFLVMIAIFEKLDKKSRKTGPDTNIMVLPKLSIESSRLDVMNFLNEMASDFPDAVSFASGRPSEGIFDLENWVKNFPDFVRHYADQNAMSFAAALNRLTQYGLTNGIINDLIARQVSADEGIMCAGPQILVTAGCQEAMDLCIKVLCRQNDDVLLVRSPTYIGITGAAELNGVAIAPFTCESENLVLSALEDKVREVKKNGGNPRLLYLVPNFDNPTGDVLSCKTREEIISFCAANKIVILEDNPYGMFRFEGEPVPSMYALDRHGCVIYLGTYSKSMCPTLRIGFAIAPQVRSQDGIEGISLIERLSQAKSFASVNTSQLTQAIAGGLLLREGCSLKRLVAPAIELYRRNLEAMLGSLNTAFSDLGEQISWNGPSGGFFLNVSLPFEFKHPEAEICARDYGVLVMPLSFFALDDRQDFRVRLAYSNVTPAAIHEGVARFALYVKDRMGRE